MSARASKQNLFVAITLAATLVCAASAAVQPQVQVLGNQTDEVVLQFQIPEFDQTAVQIDGADYLELSLPGEPVLLNAGAPALPHVTRSIIIPDDGVMGVEILSARSYDVAGIQLAPSKGNLYRNIDPARVPYVFGPEYKVDAFYPGATALLGEPYILRDFRGQVVDIYPFQYNPVQQVLRVYTEITVRITRIAAGGANVLQPPAVQRSLSAAFDGLYRSQFVNYESPARYNPLDESGDMLVICHDAWIPNVQPFVDHKNDIGIDTAIVGVSTIGNNAVSIKNYIQNLYNTSDLAFVLLVGDSSQVATPTASGGSSDPTYSKLAGSDNYPEIMVGRFSAETAAHVDTQVLRTVEYEQNTATLQDWFWKGTGIASSQGAGIGDDGEADWQHMNNIRTLLMNLGYTTVDQIYDTNGGTAAMVTTALNAGRGIINYCGHGSETSWSTTGFNNNNVNALQNHNMLPFIVSVACVNGYFAGTTCFAEAWMRATHAGEPTGAIGTYMSSINQSWAPPMEGQDHFNDLYVAGTYVCYGTLCFGGSCSMMDAYGSGGVEMFNTWIVFGDPSLRVVGTTIPPHGIEVTPADSVYSEGQAGGPFSLPGTMYTVRNKGDFDITYNVSSDANWLGVSSTDGLLAPDGTVEVNVALNARAALLGTGTYVATVSFNNMTDHDGDCSRTFTLQVGLPAEQYFWSLDTNPGWSTQGQWAWGAPTGAGSHLKDPSSGHTGSYVYGYNLNGDYTNNMARMYLTTTAIDCHDLSSVSLKFWRWLGVEASNYDHAGLEISTDGVLWSTVWEHVGAQAISESSWTLKTYNISAVADNQATVYLRWAMGTTDAGVTYPGWNIDDIAVWGVQYVPPAAQPGDMTCDGAVNFADINPFVLALTNPAAYEAQFPDCNLLNADIDGDGSVGFGDINPFVNLLTAP